jgi:hypothetical protein
MTDEAKDKPDKAGEAKDKPEVSGKLNADHGAGRMPRAANLWRGRGQISPKRSQSRQHNSR